jgi:TPR repeat protein
MSKRYLARTYSSGLLPDPDSKLEELWYRRAADQGSIQAKYDLGALCREQKRYSEALELFESCAADGFAPSMNALAYMNFEGEGTNRNQKRAEELWKRAISLGNLLSKRNYGWRLVKGSYGIAGIPRGILLLITMRFQYPKLRRLNRFDERLI